ncbi:SRPBCC family protein [Chitinophaga sp.]|uniref:SRPBCC family protein n=1 Tax=Chitinophaga sp. TaxID=1869181 RepID=UPI0031DC293D
MKETLISEATVAIEATPQQVWEAITTPDTVHQFLLGTQVTSDWKEGSEIIYEGEYNGKKYRDKGVIKKMEPGKVFQSTFLSGTKEDKPENYHLVTYNIWEKDGKTMVTLSQDNIHSEKELEHSNSNWAMVLEKLKEILEKS